MTTYEELYAQHLDRTVGWVRLKVCPANVDDVVQTVWVKVFRNLAQFRGDSAFTSWLYRIAQNEIKMYYRRQRMTLLPLGDFAHLSDRGFRAPRINDSGAYYQVHGHDGAVIFQPSCLESRHYVGELLDRIERLPERARWIMRGTVAGRLQKDMAAELGCPIGTIKSELYRLRKELRRGINGLS
jgi:RNA polymerase sigma-70 factor (ECF subfamily)